MSDPLSITLAVAGLLQLSAKVYKILSTFITNVKNAPQSAFDLLLNVFEMRLALTSVSELVDSFIKVPLKRRAMVQLDHLIICITQSVLTFSNLDEFVSTWPERIQTSVWDRLRFAR
ncbi:hypothetical protein F4677DRAFT_436692 [Hypoxylon crocopeplum]|nr:hypothetical protein F4677DRAFT_436692 [Hypoxylon crocopeplum]